MKRIEWTLDMIDKLGTVPDHVLAAEVGCSHQAVSYKRLTMGIARYSGPSGNLKIDWAAIIPDMHTMSDSAVGRKHGISSQSVSMKRKSLNIPPKVKSGVPKAFTDEMKADYATMPLRAFAAKHERSVSWARYKALQAGLAPRNLNYIPPNRVPDWVLDALGEYTDCALADACGVSRERIRQLREQANKPRARAHDVVRRLLKEKLDAEGVKHYLTD